MGEIHLIRHGQASFGERNYDRLSPTGIVQSRRLGAWWRENGIDFDAVFSGERERQKDTALLALEERGRSPGPLGIDPSFNELDADRLLHHALPRLILREPQLANLLLDLPANRDAFRRVFERIVDEWVAGEWLDAGIGTWAGFSARVREGLAAIARQQGPGRRIAVFTSGGPITVLLQHLGNSGAGRLDWNIANTSITRLAYDEAGNFSLLEMRVLPHLESDRELVTHL